MPALLDRSDLSDLSGLSGLDDRALLLGGRWEVVAGNRASARRWARLVEFHRRRAAVQPPSPGAGRQAVLNARQETVVEVGELWAMPERWVRQQLNTALCLTEHRPLRGVWQLCQDGSLDSYRATLVADAVREHLSRAEEIARFAAGITGFLRRHLTAVDIDGRSGPAEGAPLLVTCTPRQLRNRISYQLRILRSGDSEARFRRKHAERRVTARPGDDGMGWLSVNATTDQVQLAHHRLTLAAKAKRAAGDARSLDQLRSDLAVDLLVGRGSDVPVPGYARPVVNVTVPVQTLMGIADHPGVLSGGEVIPAGLARMIATQPGSTWHRMLTDPAGQVVELSTKSYRPTGPIWRRVVAEHSTCFRGGCDRPSTVSELDHRIAWPQGATSAVNLWPGCGVDHRAKHTPGFGIEADGRGGYVLRTRAGFRHRIPRTTQPWDTEFAEVDLAEGIQLSATEFVDTLMALRRAEADRPLDIAGIWEEDPLEGFDAAHRLDEEGRRQETAA